MPEEKKTPPEGHDFAEAPGIGFGHKRPIGDTAAMTPEALRPVAAARNYGISPRTFSRYAANDPAFPTPMRLSKRLVLYRRAELDAYFSSKQGHATTTENTDHARA